MTAGNIASWKKGEGEAVNAGDVIAEVETDKATVDYEMTDDGFIAKILVPEGAQDVPVGSTLAVIVESVDEIAAFKDFTLAAAAPPAAAAPAEAAAPPPATAPAAAPSAPPAPAPAPAAPAAMSSGGVGASPLAKTLAAQKGLSLVGMVGTGLGGRVIAADVQEAKAVAATAPAASDASAAAPAAPAVEGEAFMDLPHTNIRKVTAARMVENKNSAPHYYLTMEIGMDELMSLRAKLNAAQPQKTSVNDFIIKACAKALQEVPVCNSEWTSSHIRQYKAADISVAVNTPRGLLTPIVFGAQAKSITQIGSDVKELAAKAKDGSIKPTEFIGGTFTVSNLGMFGLKQFTAIINGPQACILAVGGTERKVVPNDGPDAEYTPFVTKSVMLVTLSSDHRVVDGAIGSEWLASFKRHMENPLLLLL